MYDSVRNLTCGRCRLHPARWQCPRKYPGFPQSPWRYCHNSECMGKQHWLMECAGRAITKATRHEIGRRHNIPRDSMYSVLHADAMDIAMKDLDHFIDRMWNSSDYRRVMSGNGRTPWRHSNVGKAILEFALFMEYAWQDKLRLNLMMICPKSKYSVEPHEPWNATTLPWLKDINKMPPTDAMNWRAWAWTATHGESYEDYKKTVPLAFDKAPPPLKQPVDLNRKLVRVTEPLLPVIGLRQVHCCPLESVKSILECGMLNPGIHCDDTYSNRLAVHVCCDEESGYTRAYMRDSQAGIAINVPQMVKDGKLVFLSASPVFLMPEPIPEKYFETAFVDRKSVV